MAGAVPQLVERGLVVVVGRRELAALGQHDLVAVQVVERAVAGHVTDGDPAVLEHPLGVLVHLPERLGRGRWPGRQPVGLLGVEHGVLPDDGRAQPLVAVNALALAVPPGPAALVVDGDLPVVLEREDAGATLAFSDLAAPGLDLAVGAPAHVAVAALLLHGGKVQAVAARVRAAGVDVGGEHALARPPGLLPGRGALADLLDDPLGELAVVFVVFHSSSSSGAVRIVPRVADLVLAAHVLGEEAVLLGQRCRHLEGLASVARELTVEVIERLDANAPLVAFHAFTPCRFVLHRPSSRRCR